MIDYAFEKWHHGQPWLILVVLIWSTMVFCNEAKPEQTWSSILYWPTGTTERNIETGMGRGIQELWWQFHLKISKKINIGAVNGWMKLKERGSPTTFGPDCSYLILIVPHADCAGDVAMNQLAIISVRLLTDTVTLSAIIWTIIGHGLNMFHLTSPEYAL